MLLFNLLVQDWKKGLRSQGFYKNLAVSFILGIFAMYLAAILLFLGFSLHELLEKIHDNLNPMELFNGIMLYIFLIGLSFRFFMQQLNTFNMASYQTLPIKRATLINFFLLKPLINPINYFLLLVVVPFALQSVMGYYNEWMAFRFVISFVLMSWFNSLMAAFLKRKFGTSLLSFVTVIAILGSISMLEYFQVYSLFHISKSLFGFIVIKPLGLILPLMAVGIAFLLNKWFFSQNYYSEAFNKHTDGDKTYNADLSFLNRFGIVGEIMSLEIKLILRHNRTKSILYMSAFFLLYGLLFYTNPIYTKSSGMLFFVAMFVSGLLMFMFGQWVISWDSSHFDSLMTQNIPIRTYLDANYYLLLVFNVVCFVLTSPYFYFGKQIMYMHLAAFIFNVGVNIYLLLFMSTFNTKRIDLSKSSAMNYQGTTFKSFLIIMPIFFLPMLIVWLLTTFASISVALWTLTLLGTIGILLRNQLITLCVSQFNRRKYALAEGFREI